MTQIKPFMLEQVKPGHVTVFHMEMVFIRRQTAVQIGKKLDLKIQNALQVLS